MKQRGWAIKVDTIRGDRFYPVIFKSKRDCMDSLKSHHPKQTINQIKKLGYSCVKITVIEGWNFGGFFTDD